jgi:uncharacterized protein (TIGR02145 family)
MKTTKFLSALLFTGVLLTGCGKDDNKDGGKPLSGRPTTMGQEGNTFEVTLGAGIEGVKDISAEVTKSENGISTVTGSVELTNPLLSELADAIFDRFPEYGSKSGNTFSADVDIKFSDIGVAFVDINKKEYTNVEYNAKVGDTYTTTINGKTYTRTVIGKSNMTVMRTGGERLAEEIELTEVESKDHDFPNLEKVIYYFNKDYGLVKATAFFLDGTEKTIHVVSSRPNLVLPTMGVPASAFNSNLTYGTLNDIDGNTYRTIEIGSQTWMAENLYTSRLNDGTNMPEVETFNSFSEPGWYYFESEYGFYYNKFAVTSGKLCPDGWRVPTKLDWEILATEVGDIEEVIYGTLGRSGFIAKDRDKLASSSNLWDISNNFNNSSGFSLLPNGMVSGSSGNRIDEEAVLWAYSNPHFYLFEIANFPNDGLKAVAESAIDNKGYGCRCVKE